MSADAELMARRYDPRSYTCAHFAAEVWARETGEDILPLLLPLVAGDQPAMWAERRAFERLPRRDLGPALVLMRARGLPTHAGVLVRGRVIHLTERGVERLPLPIASRGYRTVGLYRPRPGA